MNFSKKHFQTTTLGPKTVFEVVWMYFVAALNAVRKRVPLVQVTHKFVPQIIFINFSKKHFQTTTLGPKTVFEVVWTYFVAALNALRKRVPLVQLTHKFVPQIIFMNFSKKHFQTTTLGPKTVFVVVWMYFVAALNAVRKRVPEVQLTHKFVLQNFFLNFSKKHSQTTTLGPKTVVEVVWMYFVAALNAVRKRVPQVQVTHKFVPQNFFMIFSKKHFQTTTLGPNPVFEVLSMYFVAALNAVRKRVPQVQVTHKFV